MGGRQGGTKKIRAITFTNLKGGTAKTTSALSVAAQLAAWGRAVLLVDLDPQHSLTLSAGLPPSDDVLAVLTGERDPSCSGRPVESFAGAPGRLDIVTSDRSLAEVEGLPAQAVADGLTELLRAAESAFDYVVIDPPPQSSPLVVAAYAVADIRIVPVASGRAALDGLVGIRSMAAALGLPDIDGAFVARVNAQSVHDRALVEHVRGLVPRFDAFVRETVTVREAEMSREPLPLFAPRSTAAEDAAAKGAAALTRELKRLPS